MGEGKFEMTKKFGTNDSVAENYDAPLRSKSRRYVIGGGELAYPNFEFL